MAPPRIPLAAVTDRSKNFTVVVRLESLPATKKSFRGEDTLQNLLFSDKEGTEMPAVIYREDIPDFKKVLHEGHEYAIQNPTIALIPEQYRYGNQKYQMRLKGGIFIDDLGTTEVTKTFWVPVNSIEDNHDRRDRIDLLGVAIHVRPLRTVPDKQTGEGIEVRDIVIVDYLMSPVVVTAWRSLALEPVEKVAMAIESLPVIQITRVKTSRYRGGGWSTTRYSTLALNSTITAAEELQIWATNNKEALQQLSNTFQANFFGESSTQASMSDENSETIVPISSLANQEANRDILVKGKIKEITNPDNFIYNSCSTCRNSTKVHTGEHFRCEALQTPHDGISKSTYALRIVLIDDTGESRITLYDSLAEVLLKKPVTQVADLTIEDRRSIIDETLTRTKNQEFVIKMVSYKKAGTIGHVRFVAQQITEANE